MNVRHTMREITPNMLVDNGYWVSSCGSVLSFKYGKERVLKPAVNNCGYNVVNLRLNGKSTLLLVHRWVGLFYIPVVKGKEFINHIDNNKQNNVVSNLEWCSHKENMHHAIATGTFM